jgi:hypothetical protein
MMKRIQPYGCQLESMKKVSPRNDDEESDEAVAECLCLCHFVVCVNRGNIKIIIIIARHA